MKKILILLLKNLGIIIVLAGTVVLAATQFKGILTNTWLLVAAGLFVLGLITHIFINKRVE
jgi:membrane protein YdbS with pleckstrin-like domain